MGGSSSRRRVLVALQMGALAALLAAAPATAQQYSSDSWTWTDGGSYECGPGNVIDWTGGGSVTESIRTGTGEDAGAFFAHDRYQWHEVDTRRSDGLQLFINANGNVKETKATHVSGTVFEFTSVEAGQPFVIRDGNGTVISRDRGSIRQTVLFDTGGDAVPGGVVIEQVSLQINGPHPVVVSGFDFCAYFG
jgi:hypothetical protein